MNVFNDYINKKRVDSISFAKKIKLVKDFQDKFGYDNSFITPK